MRSQNTHITEYNITRVPRIPKISRLYLLLLFLFVSGFFLFLCVQTISSSFSALCSHFRWATYNQFFLLFSLVYAVFAPTARDGAMFLDFCRCRHFYLYQSQIFIVFVVYCWYISFVKGFVLVSIREGQRKGLVVIATAVNVVNALTIDLFTSLDEISNERIEWCQCI